MVLFRTNNPWKKAICMMFRVKSRLDMSILHATLATRNVDATVGFFHSVFGWQVIKYPSNVSLKAGWLRIDDQQELHVVEAADFEPSVCEREYGRHIALSFPESRWEELQRRLVAAGAELIEPQRDTPFRRLFFRDPNGYVFEVIAR